jgi:hypothetical protein
MLIVGGFSRGRSHRFFDTAFQFKLGSLYQFLSNYMDFSCY